MAPVITSMTEDSSIIDVITGAMETVVETLGSNGARLVDGQWSGTATELANSYQHLHDTGSWDDQVAFFANAALNTVEKAAAVFLKGFHTFRFTCTQNDPDQYVRDGTLVADFGSFECVLNLMNQMSKPLSINLLQRGCLKVHLRSRQSPRKLRRSSRLGRYEALPGLAHRPCPADD